MRRLLTAALAASALALAVSLSVVLAAGAQRARRVPKAAPASAAHLRVTQIEYRLLLSSGVIKAGPVDLQEIDGGMDPHDLRLHDNAGGATIDGALLEPGQHWSGVVYLRPGTYKLWCSLPEHERLGMHATLRVVP